MIVSIESIIENIVMIESVKGDTAVTYMITFTDGSQLEYATDRIYNYPMGCTSGFAENVSALELQYISIWNFTGKNLKQA